MHTASFYTEKLLHTKLLHTEAFTQRSLYTEKLYTEKLLHTASFHTQQAFTQRSFYTEELLHTASCYTQQAFTQRSIYTEKLLHTEAFTHRSFYTQKPYTQQAFTQRIFYKEKPLHREVAEKLLPTETFTQRSFYTHTQAFSHKGARNCSSKTGSRRQSKKKTLLKHCSKGIVKRKSPVQQITIATLLNNLYEAQLQKTKVLRTQLRRQPTLTAAIKVRSGETELQNTKELRAMASKNGSSKTAAPKQKKDEFEALCKVICKKKSISEIC